MTTGDAHQRAAPHARRPIPVVEIFGPTIQGEGAEAGLPTHFVRVGGCDYRCSWCDTMYAVDPAVVRATAASSSADEIVDRDRRAGRRARVGHDLAAAIRRSTISATLVDGLHAAGYRVSVETQGSRLARLARTVDRLTISPKPPSSGMATARTTSSSTHFMDARAGRAPRIAPC